MSTPVAAAAGSSPVSRLTPSAAVAPPVFAPLLPIAVAATAGIALDRYLAPSLLLLLVGVALTAALCGTSWRRGQHQATFWLLLIGTGLLAGTWHHVRHQPWANDISNLPAERVPLARLRGVVLDYEVRPAVDDPLQSLPGKSQTLLLLRVCELEGERGRLPVTGRCRVSFLGNTSVAVGDHVEALGELSRAQPPGNPGEVDMAALYRDQEIGATLRAGSVTVIEQAGIPWPSVLLARVRWWAGEQLDQALTPNQAALARALLLGEQGGLGRGQFADFQRTGVYHILAISGQHLAILCALLWPALRVLPLPRGQRALVLALAVLVYALLTGGRPPILRAAIMVCTYCGGIMLRRPAQPVNSLALAWLLILILNPADVFQTGCQISFLCVLVLLEVLAPFEQAWRRREPLDQLVEQARPWWQQALLGAGRWCFWAFFAGAVLWIVVTPLAAARYHLVSPAAVVLGPPLVILSSIALLAGFCFLLVAGLGAPFTWPFVALMKLGLGGSAQLVAWAEAAPLAYWHTAGPPEWWLVGFYGGLLTWILLPAVRAQWRAALLAGLGWLVLLLLLPGHRPEPDALRCTILAVGHGSCAVLELPDGRVLLYDAGSITGPEVTTRQIAPFLWERGITRLDEVFLSHADLDHFNGLPAVLERFAIGQVSVTPSFFAKDVPGVRHVSDELTRRGTALRVLSAGAVLDAGAVRIEVLHPPMQGPEGTENARSLVLLVRYAEHTLLLTGDLEGPGLDQVMAVKAPSIDVLLAPHHGSAASNTERFAAWATPRLVVASEGRERGRRLDPYAVQNAQLWRTSREGAVTIRIYAAGIQAETYRTQQSWRPP